MVQDSRKTLRADTLKPVNIPELVLVEESGSSSPAAIRMAHSGAPFKEGSVIKMARRKTVTFIDDRWRIDDEWWRSEPVSRLYYAVRFSSGQRLVIYKDLISGQWYKQTY